MNKLKWYKTGEIAVAYIKYKGTEEIKILVKIQKVYRYFNLSMADVTLIEGKAYSQNNILTIGGYNPTKLIPITIDKLKKLYEPATVSFDKLKKGETLWNFKV